MTGGHYLQEMEFKQRLVGMGTRYPGRGQGSPVMSLSYGDYIRC